MVEDEREGDEREEESADSDAEVEARDASTVTQTALGGETVPILDEAGVLYAAGPETETWRRLATRGGELPDMSETSRDGERGATVPATLARRD